MYHFMVYGYGMGLIFTSKSTILLIYVPIDPNMSFVDEHNFWSGSPAKFPNVYTLASAVFQKAQP